MVARAKSAQRRPTKPRSVKRRAEERASQWWLYLLACRDGRTYVGIAIDVQARFALHAQGKGAKFTRSNPPLKVLGAQVFSSRSDALKAEYALKQLDRVGRMRWARENQYV